MAKTRIQLVNRALEKLLVVGAGQSADSEDVAKVDAIVESVIESLSDDQTFSVQAAMVDEFMDRYVCPR